MKESHETMDSHGKTHDYQHDESCRELIEVLVVLAGGDLLTGPVPS